uniref:Uncharacterized protein n=1 Tax=Meloidogyne incognita TaxID=6306 RepID=A0A914MFT1_MELIC
MNHEIVVEIEPEIVLEIDPEIEPAPQTPLNKSSEIEQETEQQQQTNNSIITATTPLTNNDSKVDSADRKNAPRRYKNAPRRGICCYLILLLFIYFYMVDSPTLELCNRTFELDENFDFYECKCFQALRICKTSLVFLQTCNSTSPAKVFRNETN